jgi:hypothetical protein
MTGAELNSLVGGVIAQLQNAGTTLIGEGGIQMNGVAADLNSQMQQLRDLIGDKIDQPLASLGANVQSAAARIYNATSQLGVLLNNQRQCLALNANLFLSGARTIVANLKAGIPFVHTDSPSVVSYTFDKISTPLVVPSDGGRFTVSGFHLWTNHAPDVAVQSEDRSAVVAQISPERASNDDSFSAVLDPATVAANAGKCLDLKITAIQQHYFLFIPTGSDRAELHMPICIPQDYETAWAAIGSYSSTTTRNNSDLGTRPSQIFYFDNSSCEDRKTVADRKVWSEIASDQSITNIDKTLGNLMSNQSNVNLSVTSNNAVSAAGWLDTASCVNVFVGRRLLHSTIYQMIVTPHVIGPVSTSDQASAIGGPIKTMMPQTQICIDIPKGASTPTSVWWFVLKQLSNKLSLSTSDLNSVPDLFESPHVTAGSSDSAMPTARVGGYVIDATFNPTPVNGKAQLCTVVQIPNQCRY